MPIIDITGQRFGRLTVLKRDETKPRGQAAYWICKCDCGTIKSIRGSNLRQSKKSTKSCGCIAKDFHKNNIDLTSLIGKQFGRLTVIERDLTKPIGKGNDAYWICQCQCGNKISVNTASLNRKRTTSCGCFRKEMASQLKFKDLTGQRFGYLVAIEALNERKHRCILWKCQCDCGKECIISSERLLSGNSYSCGCQYRNSKGEATITEILNNNNIKFQQEYIFSDLKDKAYLRFDFAIFDKNDNLLKLIEYDGEQHFIKKDIVWNREDNFEKRQEHDRIKNEYCKSHNIPLVRIPYTELNNLSLELIMGDKYLI